MLDLVVLALGLGFFALTVGYAFACDRLWGWRHDLRLCACRRSDRGAARLPDLRAAAAGAVL